MSASTFRRRSLPAATITSPATNSAAIASPSGKPSAAATSPASTASVPTRSLPKWRAFASSASLRYCLPACNETTVRDGVDRDHDRDGGERPPRRLDLEVDPPDEPGDRNAADREADRHEQPRLRERGEVLGLPVPERVAAIGGTHCDRDREEREQRGAEVGPGVRRLGEQPEAPAREPGAELDRDQEAGGPDRDERGAPLRRHGRHRRGRPILRTCRCARVARARTRTTRASARAAARRSRPRRPRARSEACLQTPQRFPRSACSRASVRFSLVPAAYRVSGASIRRARSAPGEARRTAPGARG